MHTKHNFLIYFDSKPYIFANKIKNLAAAISNNIISYFTFMNGKIIRQLKHMESSPKVLSPQLCLANINKNLYFFIIFNINVITIRIIDVVIKTRLCLLFLFALAFQLQNTLVKCFFIGGSRAIKYGMFVDRLIFFLFSNFYS